MAGDDVLSTKDLRSEYDHGYNCFGDEPSRHAGGLRAVARLAQQRERERGEAKLIAALAPLGVSMMDPPDGGDVSLYEQVERCVAEIARLNGQLAELRAALEADELVQTAGYTRPSAELDASDWRMDAYYFGFDPTGVAMIDRILSAVAHAGKAYHHTEDWTDECSPPEHLRGGTCAAWIQYAAKDAADAITTLRTRVAELDRVVTKAARVLEVLEEDNDDLRRQLAERDGDGERKS
jgi:hypothetical protein